MAIHLKDNTEVFSQRGPFRYAKCGVLENGEDDLRLQEKDVWTQKWKTVYLFAGKEQMIIAIEDQDYTNLLAGKPAYIKDVVRNHYA